jgi:hypothetical protein
MASNLKEVFSYRASEAARKVIGQNKFATLNLNHILVIYS